MNAILKGTSVHNPILSYQHSLEDLQTKRTQKTQKSHDSQMSQTPRDPRDIGEHKRKESKGNLRTDEIAQPTQLLQLPHKLLPGGDIHIICHYFCQCLNSPACIGIVGQKATLYEENLRQAEPDSVYFYQQTSKKTFNKIKIRTKIKTYSNHA